MSYYFEVAGSMFVAALRRSLSESSSLYNSSLCTLDGLLTGGGDLFTGFLITHDVLGDWVAGVLASELFGGDVWIYLSMGTYGTGSSTCCNN